MIKNWSRSGHRNISGSSRSYPRIVQGRLPVNWLPTEGILRLYLSTFTRNSFITIVYNHTFTENLINVHSYDNVGSEKNSRVTKFCHRRKHSRTRVACIQIYHTHQTEVINLQAIWDIDLIFDILSHLKFQLFVYKSSCYWISNLVDRSFNFFVEKKYIFTSPKIFIAFHVLKKLSTTQSLSLTLIVSVLK